MVALDADHRHHAVQELAMRDLKEGAVNHCPSGVSIANAAWLILATLAHNLLRWTALLGGLADGPVVASSVPGHQRNAGVRQAPRLSAEQSHHRTAHKGT